MSGNGKAAQGCNLLHHLRRCQRQRCVQQTLLLAHKLVLGIYYILSTETFRIIQHTVHVLINQQLPALQLLQRIKQRHNMRFFTAFHFHTGEHLHAVALRCLQRSRHIGTGIMIGNSNSANAILGGTHHNVMRSHFYLGTGRKQCMYM